MLEITIPLYLEKFKIAEHRRKTFYQKHHDIPQKYSDPERYQFHQKSGWKQPRLCEVVPGKRKPKFLMVIKNINSAGTARFQAINGNDIWMGVHEQIRMSMVRELGNSFAEHVAPYKQQLLELQYPVMMEMDLYTTPKERDWDLSNLWVYTKIFEDHLQHIGAIKNDNIQYITKPAAPRFIPITLKETRKMVFKFIPDTEPRVLTHIMYNLGPKTLKDWNWKMNETTPRMTLRITTSGETGSLVTDLDNNMFTANVGKKKIIPGVITDIMRKIFHECINLNCGVLVERDLYDKYGSYIDRLLKDGIQVYVI